MVLLCRYWKKPAEAALSGCRSRSEAVQPVAQTEQWVFPQHAWTCISHDDFDLFAAIALVAMNGAPGASRLFGAESAAVQSQTCIVHQAFAFVAKVLPVMVTAIDMDHCFDSFEFARQARVGLARRCGNFYPDFVQRLSCCVHLTAIV